MSSINQLGAELRQNLLGRWNVGLTDAALDVRLNLVDVPERVARFL